MKADKLLNIKGRGLHVTIVKWIAAFAISVKLLTGKNCEAFFTLISKHVKKVYPEYQRNTKIIAKASPGQQKLLDWLIVIIGYPVSISMGLYVIAVAGYTRHINWLGLSPGAVLAIVSIIFFLFFASTFIFRTATKSRLRLKGVKI